MVARAVAAKTAAAVAMVIVMAAPAFGMTPAAAHAGSAKPAAVAAPAAPAKPARPTSIQIAGPNIPGGELLVVQKDDPRIFELLMREVGWLATARSQTTAPKSNKLGPKYTLTVLAGNKATHFYELYPLAAGGPRAHRPAGRPTGKELDGWFYAGLGLSETLRFSGVPMKEKPDVVNGGIGGGVGEGLATPEVDPIEGMTDAFGEMRRLLLINGAVLLVILTGLAGMAFLIRRRV